MDLNDTAKIYTGVGSRRCFPSAKSSIVRLASVLYELGWTVRSGKAPGIDTIFETHAHEKKEIYLPDPSLYPNWLAATKIAKQFHPKWSALNIHQQNLMIRNTYEVLGEDLLSPSKFLLCWTADGCSKHEARTIETGGTGQAISIASAYRVPVFNLGKPGTYDEFIDYITWLDWTLSNE